MEDIPKVMKVIRHVIFDTKKVEPIIYDSGQLGTILSGKEPVLRRLKWSTQKPYTKNWYYLVEPLSRYVFSSFGHQNGLLSSKATIRALKHV